MSSSYTIKLNSTYSKGFDVYESKSPSIANPPSTDPASAVPTYTKLVSSNGAVPFDTSLDGSEFITRLVIVRSSDQFPIKVAIVDQLDPSTQTVTLSDADETTAESGWTFYKSFCSQPYAPASLAFTSMVETTDATSLESTAEAFFNSNNAPGVTFGLFSAIGYWASNQLYAFPGSYYCYEPPASTSNGFILPTTPVGTLVIADGGATYTPTGGTAVPLTMEQHILSSAGATDKNGLYLTAIIRDLTWEGKPEVITWGFVGTSDGSQFIAQSYENPSLPWYAVAYDMAYGAFQALNIYMAIDAFGNMLKAAGQGLQWLSENAGNIVDTIRSKLNSLGDSAGPDSAVGDEVDPINVDIDIDIDVDVDVDIDIDTDVDVDVDVDIDIDVDFIAVVDVDVDVDIDVDIDVVTDTETDIDIDTDIDTDVDVDPGAVGNVLSSIGNWIMTKALPTLIEGVALYLAFKTAGALLNAWKQADEKGIANLQPSQSTGLGLLINYMVNDQIPIATRWNTFSDYVEESKADAETLQINMSTILQTKNATADTAADAWRWSDADKAAAVAAMAAHTGDDTYEAFQALGQYTYQGKPLPLKVGTAVAMTYLKAQQGAQAA